MTETKHDTEIKPSFALVAIQNKKPASPPENRLQIEDAIILEEILKQETDTDADLWNQIAIHSNWSCPVAVLTSSTMLLFNFPGWEATGGGLSIILIGALIGSYAEGKRDESSHIKNLEEDKRLLTQATQTSQNKPPTLS